MTKLSRNKFRGGRVFRFFRGFDFDQEGTGVVVVAVAVVCFQRPEGGVVAGLSKDAVRNVYVLFTFVVGRISYLALLGVPGSPMERQR